MSGLSSHTHCACDTCIRPISHAHTHTTSDRTYSSYVPTGPCICFRVAVRIVLCWFYSKYITWYVLNTVVTCFIKHGAFYCMDENEVNFYSYNL